MSLYGYTPLLLVVIVVIALLGMPLMLASSAHHEMDCTFMSGHMALCAMNVLQHIQHWQAAFAAILVELLLVAALAGIAMRQWEAVTLPERDFARIRIQNRVPARPTLLQELFSRGILHSKGF